MTASIVYIEKIAGAAILFTVTLAFTILPARLKNAQEKTLKSISCFCGGLFLGLCFLHLIPDSLRGFQNVPSLLKLQSSYPMAEFTICVGMIIVMTAEKLANVIQQHQKNEKKNCSASKDCCKESCPRREDERTPLVQNISISYMTSGEHGTTDSEIYEDIDQSSILLFNEENVEGVFIVENNAKMDDQIPKENKETDIAQSMKSVSSVKSTAESRKRTIRTFCLIIALMIHSVFEGLTVGLQSTTLGLVTLVSLLSFHKCIIGFSLGLSIVNAKQKNFSSHLKQATLFAVASPVGILFGLIILSSKLALFNGEAVVFLTSLATGTFLFITFFEILAKDLNGNTVRDLVNFVLFLVGFAAFAGITSIPVMQV